ncbi:MAG: restriction endonuclease subunit S [Ruminococcus flavefaciens]|nr:restriction endonuclease subunit S [Ruminococcus flavefaciens]MCM1361141.1 restriction endonuclease subunit S [Clostridiales bacterium]
MTDKNKKIIEQINSGIIPDGYKKTKVGIVPVEWKEKRFEEIACKFNQKYNPLTNETEFRCIEMEHIEQATGVVTETCLSKEQASIKNIFHVGDILYGKLRPYLRKYYFADFNGVCSSEIWVLKPEKQVNNRFLFYLIQSDKFNIICNISCCGSKMPRADWEFISQYLFPVPPLPEQQKIAEILSTQDKLIELKQRLIDLKKQQKKWLMQNLLTGKIRLKGFDGEWRKVKLREVCEFIRNGYTYTPTSPKHGIKISRIETISNRTINLNNVGYAERNIDEKFKLKKGDILFSHINSFAHIGKTAYFDLNEELYHGMNLLCIRSNNSIISKFLFYWLNSDKANFIYKSYAKKAINQCSISASEIEKIKFSLPSFPEQNAIAEILSQQDKEIELLDKELELHKQKKKALMQLLLTGKVRVST